MLSEHILNGSIMRAIIEQSVHQAAKATTERNKAKISLATERKVNKISWKIFNLICFFYCSYIIMLNF
jgi:hypothetical protein